MGQVQVILSIALIAQTVCFLCLWRHSLKLSRRIEAIINFEELQKVRQNFASKVENPTTELVEFLEDLRGRGFGVVRIDPNRIMYRSPKRG